MDKLPVELLENIFEYLDTSERNKCRAVCRRWNDILTWSPLFRDERVICLRRCLLRLESEPFKSLIEGKAKCFDKMKIGQMLRIDPECDMFWKLNFSHIVSLEMDQHQSQDFPAERFVAIFGGLKHLEELTLTNLSEQNFGILKEDFMQILDRDHVKFSVLKVIVVKLGNCPLGSYYFCHKLFELAKKLIKFCPVLTEFDIICPVHFGILGQVVHDVRNSSIIRVLYD